MYAVGISISMLLWPAPRAQNGTVLDESGNRLNSDSP